MKKLVLVLVFNSLFTPVVYGQLEQRNGLDIDGMFLWKPTKVGDTLMTSVIIDSIIIQYWLVDENRIGFRDFFESEEGDNLLLFSSGSFELAKPICDTTEYFDIVSETHGNFLMCQQQGTYVDSRIYYNSDETIKKIVKMED